MPRDACLTLLHIFSIFALYTLKTCLDPLLHQPLCALYFHQDVSRKALSPSSSGPQGALAQRRAPPRERPRGRVILVLALDSSRKTSRSAGIPFGKPAHFFLLPTISSRSCSLAFRVFFETEIKPLQLPMYRHQETVLREDHADFLQSVKKFWTYALGLVVQVFRFSCTHEATGRQSSYGIPKYPQGAVELPCRTGKPQPLFFESQDLLCSCALHRKLSRLFQVLNTLHLVS